MSDSYDDYTMTEGFEMQVKRRIPFIDQHHDRISHRERKFSSTHTFQPMEVSTMLPGNQDKLRLHSSVPFLKRVKKWERTKARRLKKQITEKEREKMQQCTFRPAISNLQITNEKRIQSYHRSYQKAKRNFVRQKKMKERKIKKECTFKPDTRKSMRTFTPRKPPPSKTRKNRKRHSSARLPYRRDENRGYFVDRMSKPRNIKKEEEDPDCTFKPSINRNYFKKNLKRSNNVYLDSNAFERLSKGRKRVQTPDIRKSKIISNTKRRMRSNRTPMTNFSRSGSRDIYSDFAGRRKSISIGNFYQEKKKLFRRSCPDSDISMSKSELIAEQANRDYEEGTVSSKKRNQGNYRSSDNKTFESSLRTTTTTSSSSSPTRNRKRNDFDEEYEFDERKPKSSIEAINRFFKRNAERDALRDQRLRKLKEGYEPKHKPVINTRSRSIVGKSSVPSFLDRLQVSLASQRSKLRDKRDEVKAKHNFRPKINEKSKKLCEKNYKLRVRSNEDRYREYSESQLKIEQIRKKLDKERMKEVTFHPKINKRPRPSTREGGSRVHGGRGGSDRFGFFKGTTGVNDPNLYMKRIEENERRKRWKERKVKKEEEREKLRECTFQPKIKKVPAYVRKIAKTYHLSKMKKKKVEKKRDDWK